MILDLPEADPRPCFTLARAFLRMVATRRAALLYGAETLISEVTTKRAMA